ncbi:uncharacterized protein LOC109707341 isoform X1 [Ananas comosus]|uniref:Uncharacterized protein LOC109707341 isoform X1 n=1 Tax=Ananas comosus TaxID=4615 RepID=A0A6P5EL01_ANACO|nr:uncharacterized protein LOC109707341 isoform X1 [Ananas comosus]XP_020084123.1 uncharacterized protein LOC109707341 isoform X1 [Ananas comosus]XP_020084124.1 uncharacterized protein LOC109707341 isoform X1 [Ananas comosus]XP_020084125.1 uncharacterized protein LOC109707341 isoform X1 [Ananas comosus]
MCLMVVTVGCVYPILINYCMLCIPLSCMHSKDCVHVDKKFCAYDVSIDKKFCLDLIKQFFESVQLIGALLLLPVMVRASTLRTTVGSSASSSRATTTPSHVGSSSIGSDLPSSPPDTAKRPVTQAEPKMTDYWKATHLRHNGDWMDSRSKDVIETLEDIEKEQLQNEGPLLTPEEQMSKACGTRSGYIRGSGCGPRPSSRRGAEFRELIGERLRN